ncbi:MAG TPA: alkaline phosphatase family protein [Phycisphaerae bacterium]|nr:alkaline phosphatase family protein [Phycisphaerae bacterium]
MGSGSPLLLAAVLVCGCGVPGPDNPADSFGVDFSLPTSAAAQGAIVFFVDGLNAGIFQRMLEAGELPAVRKYFVERGTYCPRAVASTPSVTLANMTSFVTGRFPGHHGVTGINWFDRNQLLWRNYETIAQKNALDADYAAPNLYEQFPDRTTFSLFFQPHRGATKFFENWTSAGPPFFFGWYEFVDRLSLYRFREAMVLARKREEFPALMIAYLLAPDFRAYDFGVGAEQYREAIRHTDKQIGRVLADLERSGWLDKIVVALVSDHGLCNVDRHFSIDAFLREKLRLHVAPKRLWEETPFEKRLAHYRDYSVVTYGSGDRYGAICLRRPIREGGKFQGHASWPVRPGAADLESYPAGGSGREVDLLAELVGREAVDAVAYAAGPDRVRLRRKSGEVEFRQASGPGEMISHHLVSGRDPLGWDGTVDAKALAGEPQTPRWWLRATAGTQHPDLPAQILAYFRARRAGDIALFAAPGWDFGMENRAGHGGLRPGDMHVPLLIAGPGVPKGEADIARTVDVMPTLLQLLGRPIPEGLDGEALFAPSERHAK